MIICLKRISEKCFLFNVNVSTSLKLILALPGLKEDNQLLGHSEGTWAFEGHLGTWALKGHSGTRSLKTLKHSSALGTQALTHFGTWTLKALG